jgi:hypothetical protein
MVASGWSGWDATSTAAPTLFYGKYVKIGETAGKSGCELGPLPVHKQEHQATLPRAETDMISVILLSAIHLRQAWEISKK